jgi:hypothetical protein
MTSRFEKFKARALARPAVRAEYDSVAEEFELLDQILDGRRSRSHAGEKESGPRNGTRRTR